MMDRASLRSQGRGSTHVSDVCSNEMNNYHPRNTRGIRPFTFFFPTCVARMSFDALGQGGICGREKGRISGLM
jgi:hypothetical protein